VPTSKRPTFARRAKLTDPVGVLSIMAILCRQSTLRSRESVVHATDDDQDELRKKSTRERGIMLPAAGAG
jgi:hypothetical protein